MMKKMSVLVALMAIAAFFTPPFAMAANEVVIMKQEDRLKPGGQDQILGRVGNRIAVLQPDSNLCIYDVSGGGKTYVWGFDKLPNWMQKGYSKTSEMWLAPNDFVIYAGGRNIAYSAIIEDKLQAFGGARNPVEMVFDGETIAIRRVNMKSEILWQKGGWNAARNMQNKNPNSPWGYGGGTIGGDFTQYPSVKNDRGLWHHGSEGWKGVYLNNTGQPQSLSAGLQPAPGTLMLHPGNGTDHLSKIRFTAPSNGSYDVNVTFQTIDQQAKNSWAWVYTNAKSQSGTTYDFTPSGWKEIFTQGMTGYGKSVSFSSKIAMQKGEMLSFEVGNGGDKYFDDGVKVDINISK